MYGISMDVMLVLVFGSFLEVVNSLNLPDTLSYTNCKSCLRFPPNRTLHSITDVQRILIDPTNDRVIVGVRDSLFRLDPTTLRLPSDQIDFVDLSPSSAVRKTCIDQGFTVDYCYNNIKLLLFDIQGSIFTCGTYASQRRCWRFQRTGALSPTPPGGISGTGRSPQDYHQSVSGTFTRGYLFTGINLNFDASSSAIYRSEADDARSNSLQTKISPAILQDASFVASFDYPDNFVYFFLRETAVERSKMIYSRVARVCKYDEGAQLGVLKGKFTSFVKTRILCSIPGVIPFDYNHIQATFKYNDSKSSTDFVYGVFTTSELGVLGSAVCWYSMKTVQGLFLKSKYLEKTKTELHDGTMAWVSVSPPVNLSVVPGRPKCNSDLKTKKYKFEAYSFATDHPLLADPLIPVQTRPLFVKDDIRFTQLVVDKVKRGVGLVIPVMFIATDNGTVFKVFNNISGDGNAIVVQQIQVFEKPDPIYTMKLYQGAVFIGSRSSVVKLPLERCDKYQSCRTCVSIMDPYCGWSSKGCTTFDNRSGSWSQDIVHADYSKVCPEAPPVCSVVVTQERPGGTTVLLCQADGIPLPQITGWTKDSESLPSDGSYLVKQGQAVDQQQLEIRRFGMQHLGMYQCAVSNTLGSSACVINITGTLPVIWSCLVKINYTSYFTCNATGLPTPRVAVYKVIKGQKTAVNSDRVSIAADVGQRSYYCVAVNAFGSTFGKTTSLQDKEVKAELRLTSEEWSSELSDESSERYKILAGRVKAAVQKSYAENAAFVGFKEMSFSKGSVVCKMTLNFAAKASDKNSNLLSDLQHDVLTGKLGDFSVDKAHVLNAEPDDELTTTSPPVTTVLPTVLSTVVTHTTTARVVTSRTEPDPTPEPQSTEPMDDGLFAVAVVTAILLSLILGFALGVKFHKQVITRCHRSSGDPDSCDGPNNKSVEGVRFTKSPPKEEHFPRNKNETQSKRNLLKKKDNRPDAAENSDSDSSVSAAGKMVEDEDDDNEEVVTAPSSPAKSISPSVSINRTQRIKPSLENGKLANVC